MLCFKRLVASLSPRWFLSASLLFLLSDFKSSAAIPDPPPSATVVTALSNVVVGIGEFNFTSLRQGLIVTNASFGNTTHILAMNVTSSLPPFIGGVGTPSSPLLWQLSLAVSNRFFVQANTGADAANGTWGYAAAASNYLALSLTNFPRVGDISRLEAFEDGRYGIVVGGDNAKAQAGTYRVLGSRRPATNTFTVDLIGPNPVAVGWTKDGALINLNARAYVTSTKANGVAPSGGINVRVQLTIPDLTPSDAGSYSLRITNLFPNPDTTFGQPPYIVTSIVDSQPSVLTIRGFSETNAPGVIGALELGAGDPTALSVLNDGTFLIGAGTTLTALTPLGLSNWVATLPAIIRAAAPDGAGGAFIGGADNDSGNFFINRVHASTQTRSGAFIATNAWTGGVESPSTNYFENSSIPHGAEVVGLSPTSDGVYVTGRFRGKSRFGAKTVGFNVLGGVSITNVYDATFGSNDRSWDIFLAKYDLAGQALWARGYGGTNSETLTSVMTDAAGNLYLAGNFRGGANFGSVAIESTKSGTSYAADGYVAKLAPNGDPIWVKTFGGLSDNFLANTQISSAALDADGNVYFLAARDQVMLTLPIGASVGSRYLARLNSQGEMVWAQTVGTAGNSRVAVDPSGDVVLLDAFINGNTGPTILGAATLDRSQGTDAVVARFTRGGTLLWARGLGEKVPFTDIPRTATFSLISMAPSGEIYLAGSMPAGTTDSQSRSTGERFDTFELSTTNSGSGKPKVGLLVRLAPNFAPTAPALTLVSAADRPGLLQDPMILEGRATGVPAPTYQWLLNGAPLLNATNRELIFADLERTNGGSYVLVASNAFGVSRSSPIQVTPQLRPSMAGWTMVTATTNYAGLPTKIGADDAQNSYVLLDGADLRKFDSTGHFAWRFDGSGKVQSAFADGGSTVFVLSAFAPVVAPSGEVFIAGRFFFSPNNSSTTTQGNFVARLNPDTGAFVWAKALSSLALGQFDQATILAFDQDGAGHVRTLLSNKHIRSFAFDGVEGAAADLSTLPVLLDSKNYRLAMDRVGGFYFYANRMEALNLGPTNLVALGGTGAQTYILAHYDATGVFQWSRAFPGPGGVVVTPSVNVDANGNVVVAGPLSLLGAQTLQVGTNVLTGSGYAAKISADGDILWAKSWWLQVCDSALKPDGSVYLTGWFRNATIGGVVTRKIPFGTNIITGSSLTGHDQFVAKLNANGQEQFIRQTGGPQFLTEDNATAYRLTVNARGVVTTAGYSRVPRTGGTLDLGNVQMFWPVLSPTGNDQPCYYVARLEAEVDAATEIHVTFTPPAPGATTLKLTWPTGYQLQRRTSLASGTWETLNVSSPYDASVLEFLQGYFQVVSAP